MNIPIRWRGLGPVTAETILAWRGAVSGNDNRRRPAWTQVPVPPLRAAPDPEHPAAICGKPDIRDLAS